MNKIRKITLVLLFFLVLISGGAVTFAWIYEDEIRQLFITKLNERLNAKVEVSNGYQFSILANFPEASFSFNQVEVISHDKNQPKLLSAEKVSMLFNLSDLLDQDYKIRTIEITDGTLHLYIDQSLNNYQLLKPQADTSRSDWSLQLQKARLNNINLIYEDRSLGQLFNFQVTDLVLSGNFSQNIYDLALNGELKINSLKIKDGSYLTGNTVNLNSSLKVFAEEKKYVFENTSLTIEDNSFLVSGTVKDNEKNTGLNLNITGDNITLPQFLNLLPENYGEYASDIKTKGDLSFKAVLKGEISAVQNPLFNAEFSVTDGSFDHKDFISPLEQVRFKGHFTNGKGHSIKTSQLTISEFSALQNNDPLSLDLKILNFSHPMFQVSGDGIVDLSLINASEKEGNLDAEGKVKCEKVKFSGRIFDQTIRISGTSGKLLFENVLIRWKDHFFENISGTIQLNGKVAGTEGISLNYLSNDLQISGSAGNLISRILTNDTLASSPVYFTLTALSENCNVNEWLQLFAKDSSDKKGNSFQWKGTLKAGIKNLTYEDAIAQHLDCSINMENDKIVFEKLVFKAMGGEVSSSGIVKFFENGEMQLLTDAVCSEIDIRQLFTQCRNFGQETLLASHLNGKIHCSLQLSSVWDEKLNLKEDKLKATADLTINEGELIGFEPMNNMSAFVKMDDLKHVRFSQLNNEIEISDRKIFIPEMNIQSSAFNMEAAGMHTFDNEIDYKVRLNLSDLLAKRFKKNNNNWMDHMEDNSGLNIFLTMTGTVDDPKFRYDKSGVKEKIREDIKKEKEELKEVLKREFSSDNKTDKIKDWQPEEDPEYIDWE